MKGCFRLPWWTISLFTLARWPRMRSPAEVEVNAMVFVQVQARDGCTTACCMLRACWQQFVGRGSLEQALSWTDLDINLRWGS